MRRASAPSRLPNLACQAEEDLELHAMGRLEDPFLRQHFDTCPCCRKRVTELRREIALLKLALAEWRTSNGGRRKSCSRRLRMN